MSVITQHAFVYETWSSRSIRSRTDVEISLAVAFALDSVLTNDHALAPKQENMDDIDLHFSSSGLYH